MKKVLGVAAAALFSVLTLAAPASAAEHTKHMHTGDAFGDVTGWSGEGVFTEEGDRVHICDTDADGRGVAIYVYKGTPDNGVQLYWMHVGGNGNCVTKSAADGGSDKNAAKLGSSATASNGGMTRRECGGTV